VISLYLTTHKTHKRQTSVPPVGFEPAIPASERPQTHALDCAVKGIGRRHKLLGRNGGRWEDNTKLTQLNSGLEKLIVA
jgi:tetrahydromethanopterin S-methyltransferase subunit F